MYVRYFCSLTHSKRFSHLIGKFNPFNIYHHVWFAQIHTCHLLVTGHKRNPTSNCLPCPSLPNTIHPIYYMRFMIILAYQRGFQEYRELCLILSFFLYFNGHSGPALGREESWTSVFKNHHFSPAWGLLLIFFKFSYTFINVN